MREFYHLACEEIADFNARVAELLEDAEAGFLAYLDLPYEHHRRLHANNVQEKAVTFGDKNQWNTQFDWIIDTMLKMKKVFKKYL